MQDVDWLVLLEVEISFRTRCIGIFFFLCLPPSCRVSCGTAIDFLRPTVLWHRINFTPREDEESGPTIGSYADAYRQKQLEKYSYRNESHTKRFPKRSVRLRRNFLEILTPAARGFRAMTCCVGRVPRKMKRYAARSLSHVNIVHNA